MSAELEQKLKELDDQFQAKLQQQAGHLATSYNRACNTGSTGTKDRNNPCPCGALNHNGSHKKFKKCCGSAKIQTEAKECVRVMKLLKIEKAKAEHDLKMELDPEYKEAFYKRQQEIKTAVGLLGLY